MAMPPSFGFGEEEQLLRDAARRFLSDNLPVDRLHRLIAANPDPHRDPENPWDPQLWSQMADLGWTGIAVPERAGGVGMSAVAAIALAEEAGRACLPAPLVPTLAASHLLRACDTNAADELLATIGAGKAVSLAITAARGGWRGESAGVQLRDGKLYGRASFVQDAARVQGFVVKASTEKGAGLYRVDAATKGVSLHADAIVDLSRSQSRLEFDGVRPRACLAEPGDAADAIQAAEPAIFTLIAADLCGAGEWLLATTAEYARVRKQFDRPIGFFQAVKHPLVNVMVQLDMARSHVYNAAAAVDSDPVQAMRAAHMAKAAAAEAGVFAADRAVQFHGGTGFTWECYVHLFFKRQMHNAALFGDAVWHRSRLAALLFDEAAKPAS